MATIVQHHQTGRRYVLLGTGFGAYSSSRPGVFFGSLSPDEDSGTMDMVAVCDEAGQIGWVHSRELAVVEVDGRPPGELLGGAAPS